MNVRDELVRLYAGNSNPVAFLDESFETEHGTTFYVVGVAVVDAEELYGTRAALKEFYGGDALHAAPMWARMEYETLRQATRLVARENDAMDIVICSPIGVDESRDAVRARCLTAATAKVHSDFDVMLFVLDSLSTPTEETLDQRTFSDLRRASDGRLHRDCVAIHARPSQELLLGLPDVLAWAYRQEHLGRGEWFDALRECTDVTVL